MYCIAYSMLALCLVYFQHSWCKAESYHVLVFWPCAWSTGACVHSWNSAKESPRGSRNVKPGLESRAQESCNAHDSFNSWYDGPLAACAALDLFRKLSYLHHRSPGCMAQFGTCWYVVFASTFHTLLFFEFRPAGGNWVKKFGPGLVPCVLLLAGLFFIPESPRWLVRHFPS